ncbi:TetR/AcrR family transcriptional regulator [Phytohabitans aurantiacus]|uniref:Transcriptional regulator, TetR family protein n=1 Tax=Phytohabitans aurantiacus TaxID=3016789 RepID=A0ABQ5R650_9ACTN|nr:TetR family transcriptional regulator [Phytohabitans aurantiacus]GLI01026.1 putative transcriptional regulator, TetR family protein [Phytohabitans aurantiacus]
MTPAPGRQRYVDRARVAMRESILRAVEELIRDRGWEATRMADVADRAGVSRQTLYQLYGSRDALAQAYVLSETELFLGTVVDAVRGRADDPLAAIEAGLDAFLTGAADSVMVKAILQGHAGDELLPLVTTQGLPVIQVAERALTDVIAELWPQIQADDARLFAGSIVRLAISHVTAPTGTPDATVKDIVRLLTPFAVQALS